MTTNPKPQIFDPAKKADAAVVKRLAGKAVVIDDLASQIEELQAARMIKLKTNPGKVKIESRWVYLPWNGHLVHVLPPAEFFELRTARNRNLITKTEQVKFKNTKIGVAGLSVGNSVAVNLALEGADNLRLADFDTLSLSNLNRIRAGIQNLRENKASIAAKQIYELNPYATLSLFAAGLGSGFEKFISGLDIVVDEIDDVVMKIKLRLAAKKLKLPVVSAADNGDNSIVSIERFDLEPARPIYHGELGKIDLDKIQTYGFKEKLKLINTMVGYKYVTPRMKASLAVVGKEIYSWPQLGGAATLSGSAVTYAARRIALGMPMRSGRYNVSLDKIFGTQS